MVLNKLRPWAPPATESLDPRFLEAVVGTLFSGATSEENSRFTDEEEQEPQPSEEEPRDSAGSWSPESRVTEEELAETVGRIGARKALDSCLGANSPFCGKRHGWSRCRSQDALRTRLPHIGRSAFWAELASYWREWWRSVSSRICPGVFPDCTTVSLASGGDGPRPTMQPVSASWLRGPSSAVAWSWLCRWTWSTPSTASSGTGYARPSSFIGYAGAYLWSVVRAFLRDRSIVYTVRGEGMTERAVYRGVPQGYVLGPLLWNIAYNAVLRVPMLPDSGLVCYADDTLVLVWGAAWEGIVRLAELAVTCVVAAIKGLGLTVSPEKSEAMWFCRRADHGTPPAGYSLRLEGAEIEVGTSMKDLGLTLDSHWTFRAHFGHLAPTVEATANALGRLLLRLGGPGVGMRRLTPAW
ncbi:uncharacterized protein LOC126927920 [Bombus affinis]|uniref:uncharacterized protein LOC126927920 n=1 Tax=Bombus affinis TaxID=309941 RepID=UPI0021B72810|nr:uncharacterized protein LOC126927920 [Bombus affinis]